MTKGIIGVISAVLGAAVGGGVMYFLEERKYRKILDNKNKSNDSIEVERQKFIEERAKKFVDDATKVTNLPFEMDQDGKILGIKEDKKEDDEVEYSLEEIKAKLRKGKQKVTDYTKLYSASDLVDAKNDDDSEKDEEEEDEENEIERTSSNIFNELQKSTRAPKIVKSEEVDEEHEGWDVNSLFLYSNGVLTDEDDHVIDGEEKDIMVGDCLTKYDFLNSDERMIYIKCFKFNTFYEVTKFDKPFED